MGGGAGESLGTSPAVRFRHMYDIAVKRVTARYAVRWFTVKRCSCNVATR